MKLYQIYQEHQLDFIRFANSLTHQMTQAEDLVQEAYLKALDQDELFDSLSGQQIKGWFFTTIRNRFIDDRRKQSRLVAFTPEHSGNHTPDFDSATFIQQTLALLNEQERSLVSMRYIQGYNSSEIAEKLSMNPSTVRNKLSQGINRIRTNMLKEGHHDWN
ncbi:MULTISPECIES: RNA polymerase sigma factor [unclassified Fusibacter]|uniref:RNA polymerase sigma factor n=1 Tax=unclassified Fusibacter TaxID=2624464 RepID=UPI001013B9B7|nr:MULTISPECIES: RNA polymerase sigma factor [unclassified Fusibacter]MCK8059633.1 RNA polymerase sigma factor [Fusibacter sp. A2]NPE21434.1 RNA polymerase sigma factor [Fusibacter sp. A1]RXV61846.1 RNA polymerase sigma factor [Fusibacter sp. A1]